MTGHLPRPRFMRVDGKEIFELRLEWNPYAVIEREATEADKRQWHEAYRRFQMSENKVSGDTHIEGMIGVFESCLSQLAQKMESLKDDTLSSFGEVHDTIEEAKARNARLREANAKFRAYLGFSNAGPMIEAKTDE